ncbi:hypothetical protein V8D89_002147 [Ganoderma adspersum]
MFIIVFGLSVGAHPTAWAVLANFQVEYGVSGSLAGHYSARDVGIDTMLDLGYTRLPGAQDGVECGRLVAFRV